MTVASISHADLTRRIFEFAEQRLGRPMTAAELRMDVATMRSQHGQAKVMLADAIREEMARVVAARRSGVHARVAVTRSMVKALEWIYERGVEHAQSELEQIGVRHRSFATPDPVNRLTAMRLVPMLGGINVRIDAASTAGDLNSTIRQTMLNRLATQAPGALDAASRLISTGFTSGLNDVFSGAEADVAGWQYTAVMDDTTCDECESHDGEEYDTLDQAFEVLPDFGPNPDCYGEGRCRCRLVPTGAADGGGDGGSSTGGGGDLGGLAAQGGVSAEPDPNATVSARYTNPRDVPAFRERVANDDSAWMAQKMLRPFDTPQSDPRLYDFAVDQGFAGKPHVVDEAELDAYIQGGERELFRGVGSSRDIHFTDQFRNGEYFAGLGVYGNGTYAAYSITVTERYNPALEIAKDYGSHVMRMSLKADAKVISFDDARQAMNKDLMSMEGFSHKELDAATIQMNDVGRWAILHGYDAIDVKDAAGDRAGYMVILNRTALRVSRHNVT